MMMITLKSSFPREIAAPSTKLTTFDVYLPTSCLRTRLTQSCPRFWMWIELSRGVLSQCWKRSTSWSAATSPVRPFTSVK